MALTLHSHPLAAWGLAASLAGLIGVGAGIAGSPTAHDSGPVEGVVLEVSMETQSYHPVGEVQQANALGMLIWCKYSDQPPDECLEPVSPPEPVTTEYTLYVTDDKVRLDFSGQSMLGRVGSDGSFGDWGVLDRATGRLVAWEALSGDDWLPAMPGSEVFTELADQLVDWRSKVLGPELEGSGEAWMGHSVSRYSYFYSVSGTMALEDGAAQGLMLSVHGTARYADDDFADDDVAAVLGQVGPEFLFQHLGSPEELSTLPGMGMLVGVEEVATIVILDTGSDAFVHPIVEGKSSASVTSARWELIPDSVFAPLEEGEQGCNCSCRTFEELRAFSRLSKEEQRKNPRLMGMVTCARECMPQWTGCVG